MIEISRFSTDIQEHFLMQGLKSTDFVSIQFILYNCSCIGAYVASKEGMLSDDDPADKVVQALLNEYIQMDWDVDTYLLDEKRLGRDIRNMHREKIKPFMVFSIIVGQLCLKRYGGPHFYHISVIIIQCCMARHF